MPTMQFIAGPPRLSLRQYARFSSGWNVTFPLKAPNRIWHQIDLTGPEKIDELEVTLHVVEHDSEIFEGHDAKGFVRYYEGSDNAFIGSPPACNILIRVAEEDERKLLDLIQSQIPLESVNVSLQGEGAKFGRSPDGSDVKWDNVEHPELEIEGFTLFWGRPSPEQEPVDAPIEPPPSPSRIAARETDRVLAQIERFRNTVISAATILTVAALANLIW